MAKEKKSKPKLDVDSVQELVGFIVKDQGDGACRIGTKVDPCEVIPTGALTLDIALGVGGIPRGRVTEIYGPEASGKTTLTLEIAANVQRAGGTVAFIDVEHALDPVYADALGVDMDKVIISQPDCAEQALSVVETLCQSGLVDLVIVDSVAAFVSRAELEGEMGGSHMAANARLLSQACRKLVAVVHKTNTALVFVNQIRMKIGVMFGCLHADNIVNFVDGRSIKIKEVVENKVKGEVWSFDVKQNTFVPGTITGWHHNGNIKLPADYLSISLRGPGNKNGRMNIAVTPDHKVMTQHGWLEAKRLQVGSKLLTKQLALLSGSLGDFLRGALSGDSHIATVAGHLSSSLKLRDNIDIDYVDWKAKKLNSLMGFKKTKCGDYIGYNSMQFSELTDVKKRYPNRDPMLLLSNFSWLGFSVLIMDDANYSRGRYTLSIKRFKGDFDKLDQISFKLDQLQLYHRMSCGGSVVFDKDTSDLIANKISQFVPQCMRHKLPNNQSPYLDFKLSKEKQHSSTYAEVVDIRHPSARQMRNIGKYDISIDNYHNYSVGGTHNGVIVHNSPETTTGGKALKYYSTCRIDIRRIASIKDGSDNVGNLVRVKIVKNKLAPPFKQAEFEIIFGKGVNKLGCVLDAGSDYKIIDKKGSHFTYNNLKLGNGKVNACKTLEENPEVVTEIRDRVLAKLEALKAQSTNGGGEDTVSGGEDTDKEE